MSTDGPQSLREVAQAALDNNRGVSGRQLGELAKKKGLKIVYTTINHIAAGTYTSRPSKDTLHALAVLSGFSLDEVYAAAKMPAPMAPLRDDLPPDADLLQGPQRRLVIETIRLLAQQDRRLAELDVELEELRNDARSAANSEAGESRPHLRAVAGGGPDSDAQAELASARSALEQAKQRITELEVEVKKLKRDAGQE